MSYFKRIVVFDVETGGLSSEKHGVTEIALVAIDVEKLEIVGEYSSLIKPYNMVVNKNTETSVVLNDLKSLVKRLKSDYEKYEDVTNELKDFVEGNTYIQRALVPAIYEDKALKMSIDMTTEELEEKGKHVDEVIEDILDFLGEHKIGSSKPILAGHNMDRFDIGFLEQLFNIRKRNLNKDVNMDVTLDTLKLSRIKFIDSSKHTLGVACKNSGVILKDAHRALPDTVANAKLLIEMLKSLRGDGSTTKKERPRVSYEF